MFSLDKNKFWTPLINQQTKVFKNCTIFSSVLISKIILFVKKRKILPKAKTSICSNNFRNALAVIDLWAPHHSTLITIMWNKYRFIHYTHTHTQYNKRNQSMICFVTFNCPYKVLAELFYIIRVRRFFW